MSGRSTSSRRSPTERHGSPGHSRSRSPARRRTGTSKHRSGGGDREPSRGRSRHRHSGGRDSSASGSSRSSSSSDSSDSSDSSGSVSSDSSDSGKRRSSKKHKKHKKHKKRSSSSSSRHKKRDKKKHKKRDKKHKKHKKHKKDKKHKKHKKQEGDDSPQFATLAEAQFVQQMSNRLAAKRAPTREPTFVPPCMVCPDWQLTGVLVCLHRRHSHLEKLAAAGKQAAQMLRASEYKDMRKVTRLKATCVHVPAAAEASFVSAARGNVSFADKCVALPRFTALVVSCVRWLSPPSRVYTWTEWHCGKATSNTRT